MRSTLHLLAALALAAQPVRADCQLMRVAALDIAIDRYGGITVPAAINGHDVHLMIDTGGAFSAIAPEMLAAIGLEPKTLGGGAAYMFGGRRMGAAAKAQSFKLGSLDTSRMSFIVLPPHSLAPDVAGTIGAEVLGDYDVDIDIGHGKLNLFRRNGCGVDVVYWSADPWGQVDLLDNLDNHLTFHATLDGHPLKAMLDTGMSVTEMDLASARAMFGWSEAETPKPDKYGEAQHSFGALTFDALSVGHPQVTLDARGNFGFVSGSEETPIIVGMDVLKHLHLYISYQQRKIYFTAADAH
ncbi:MAG TPA: retropepsin-like aspartic protease [Rhizomicrobium sp.]|nr:retropepsin-like aspartic protease [Rhizomicrobium sp.]